MLSGAELIIKYRDGALREHCIAYRDLHLANPVLILLAELAAAPSYVAEQLFQILDAEITGPLGGTALRAPCGGQASLDGCHAFHESDCQKLLVLAGGDAAGPCFEAVAFSDHWQRSGPNFTILPVLPEALRSSARAALPASAAMANAVFFDNSPADALPAIFAHAGITAEQSRLFISYRQIDSAALAIQLFDALSHAGFDVFLDHFRIPPGVNFQARLTQELGDKSMVLILESERLGESQWVAHEISVARSCGLGLLGLLLPRGEKQPSLDDGYRQVVVESDFNGSRFDDKATLTDVALARVVASIKTQHDRVMVARRRMLEISFEGALRQHGCANIIRLANGAFEILGIGKKYRVWLTSRPPELPDFHRAHREVVAPAIGVIIGLSRLMEPARATSSRWLAGLCVLELADEGQMSQVALAMAGGRL